MSLHSSPKIATLDELEKYCTHDRKPFFDIALDFCRDDSLVLDIGAGQGDFARLVKSRVTLVDANPSTVEQLREEFDDVLLHRVPDPLPVDSASYDLVHCSHIVEHLAPNDLYALMQEVDRVLRPGGVFVVSAPLLWSGFYDDLSHVRPYTPRVFMKYMCELAPNATRGSAASLYVVEKLVYRHSKVPPAYYDFSVARRWPKQLLFKLVNRLRRHALARYEVSGFTLAMRKPRLTEG